MKNKAVLLLLAALLLVPAPPEAAPKPASGPAVQVISDIAEAAWEPEEEPAEEPPDLPPEAQVIEDCTVTWYTEDTCGKTPDHPAYGVTASGLPVEEGVTCAVDPDVIPLFSRVWVVYADGQLEEFRATDTGVSGNWVDIYTPDYDLAIQCGLQKLTVYWTAPGE